MVLRKTRGVLTRTIDFFYPPFRRILPIQTFRYLACGGSNAVLDVLIYYAAYNHLFAGDEVVHFAGFPMSRHVASLMLSMVICTPLGFLLNKYIVFPGGVKRGRVQLFRYALLVATCAMLNVVVLKFLVEWCHLRTPNGDTTIAKIATSVIVAVFSYFSQRHFTFQQEKS